MSTFYNRIDYKTYYSIVDCRRATIKCLKDGRIRSTYCGIYVDDYIKGNDKGGLVLTPKSEWKVWAYWSFESNIVYKLNQDGTLGKKIGIGRA